jgi:hypothetical protein
VNAWSPCALGLFPLFTLFPPFSESQEHFMGIVLGSLNSKAMISQNPIREMEKAVGTVGTVGTAI